MARRVHPTSSAADFLPARRTLDSLRAAAAGCRGCELWKRATQTVFGEGRPDARVVLVGEQPGHEEDLEGRPFVGPAGRLLDRALEAAGIARDDVYVTNVVKHFKWDPRGKRRIHAKPNRADIAACLPWLHAELDVVSPDVVVCLGSTAAQALLGPGFRVTKQRGQWVSTPRAARVLATVHPSSILRAPDDEARQREFDALVADLAVVHAALG
ncbi:MAG TPA: UdgX family uracil-DNA binding protein [Candidatus Acidoferrum sp.]|jgi:uracil-DNA glycosylase family protein|nr:UdgX family uracil-DNA binding protein [Candidatus Acidoferrum sp.]